MEITILGSGGCMVIPKPLCRCGICQEAREKGPPFARTGPSAFLHGANLLIDTPAEIALQLNRSKIQRIDYLLFTHFDPDHVEGFRVVEQISLDFRTWCAYKEKRIKLIIPEQLNDVIRNIRSVYGPLIDFYEDSGFIERIPFRDHFSIRKTNITAIPIKRGAFFSFIYVFKDKKGKIVYAPCDIKPFPKEEKEIQAPDLLVIQPGLFEDGLKHRFKYSPEHISRKTLYTFKETIALAQRIRAKKILFVHLEEYWNRSYDDYLALEKEFEKIRFAYDGLRVNI